MNYLGGLSIAFAIVLSATGDAVADGVTVKGMQSCGAWVKDRAEQPAPSLSAIANSAWLAGYLSGVAVARNIDFLKGVDDNTVRLWTDNDCSRHSSDLMGDAADALSVELKNRMH